MLRPEAPDVGDGWATLEAVKGVEEGEVVVVVPALVPEVAVEVDDGGDVGDVDAAGVVVGNTVNADGAGA